jgi:hypothetical protein
MALNVKIGNQDSEETPPDLTVELKGEEKQTLDLQLKLRSALNGDLMILDHKDIDIIIQPKNNKVVTFAKDILSDVVYGAESRLLEFLRSHGVIEFDSIQGGNIYGSLEGKIMESDTHDSIKATLLNISEWMKTEQPYMKAVTAYDQMEDDALIAPDNADSTDLGQVDQAEKKGSIDPSTIFAPYMYGRFAY